MDFVYNDGGREAAIYAGHGDVIGFSKTCSDCACRSIAIATQQPYQDVFAALAQREKYERRRQQPDGGIYDSLIRRYMTELGWVRTLCSQFGWCNTTRLETLPQEGRIVVVTTRHCCALVDGVLHDTWNCSTANYIIHSYWRQKT